MLVGSANRDVKAAIKTITAGFPIDAICYGGDGPTDMDEFTVGYVVELDEDEGGSCGRMIAIQTDSEVMATIIAAHETGHAVYAKRHPIMHRLQELVRTWKYGSQLVYDVEVQAWKIGEALIKRRGLWKDLEVMFNKKKVKCLKTYERR